MYLESLMMRTKIFGCALLLASSVSCDPPKRDPVQKPSAGEIRQFMGLVDGNCWRYKLAGSRTYLNTSVSGPNTIAIAGRSLYVRKSLSDSGDFAKDEYFDTGTEAELQLARRIEGRGSEQVVRTYEVDSYPLVGVFDFGDMGEAQFAEAIFRTTTTPMGLDKEDHQWTVVSTEATGTTHDGMSLPAYDLSGQRNTESPERFTLVPGYGFTKFTTSNGKTYQVCDACVSDTDGACTETQCTNLKNCD